MIDNAAARSIRKKGLEMANATCRVVVVIIALSVVTGILTISRSSALATQAVSPRPSPACSTQSKVSSVGAGSVADNSGSQRPTQRSVSFSADGDSGSYLEETPATARGNPVPVVIDLHGYLESDSLQDVVSGLGAFGVVHGFITITPQVNGEKVPHWDVGARSNDVRFLGDLLSHVEDTLCVDEARIFVTGYSNGAWMTSRLACAYANRLAAVAPVAGLQDYRDCHPSRPVPVVAFHGTDDPFVAWTGGSGPKATTLPSPNGSGGNALSQQKGVNPRTRFIGPLRASIPQQVNGWASRNGCAHTPNPRSIGTDVTLLTYECATDASVDFYEIMGGGHSWPGSPTLAIPASAAVIGRTTMTISATQIMWQFFRDHPLRLTGGGS